MSLLPFTQKANDALVTARQRAVQDQHPELVPKHLLAALLQPEAGLHSLLERAGLAPEAIQGLADAAEELITRLPRAVGGAEPQVGPAFRHFLEVASDNGAAEALYNDQGFRTVGRRKGYYGSIDALTMRRSLESGEP